jgi:tRNA (guanine37-N1)-methyltransferase
VSISPRLMKPPSIVKGLTVLKRELYKQSVSVPAARVEANKVGLLRAALKRDLVLTMPRIKTVLNDANDPQKRLLLLNPDLVAVAISSPDFFLKLPLKDNSNDNPGYSEEDLKGFGDFEAVACMHELILDYAYWSADEILGATLPDGMDVPSSFETIGHIAHINLREEHEPYKHLIGQVILDKNPIIRTVVNKVGSIEATFRFFEMELLAGEDRMQVEVKEEGCVFKFDYSKVYWNSRLQHEHRRLVSLFKKDQRICDLFCGVGPFALPAAKRSCIVYANDLNPESVKYLQVNREANKISSERLLSFNSDARDFIMQSHNLINENREKAVFFDHYIMNLPASAHEFLDAFGPLRDLLPEVDTPIIWVHCYVFCRVGSSPVELVEKELAPSPDEEDFKLPEEHVIAHYVRNVAPNKDMYCVSLRLLPSSACRRKRIRVEEAETKQ